MGRRWSRDCRTRYISMRATAPAASSGRVADGVGRLAAAHGEHVRDAGLQGAAAARGGAAGTIGGDLPCAGEGSY